MQSNNQPNKDQEAVSVDNSNHKGRKDNQDELKEKMGLNNGVRAIGGA